MGNTFTGTENKANTDFINQLLANTEVVVTDNVAMTTANRQQLAKIMNKNVGTITRALKRLEKANIIKVEFKRGADGGYVVMFNPDMFEFPTIDSSILINPTRHHVSLLDKVMPSKHWRVHGVRLTDMQLDAYNKQQVMLEKRDSEYNQQLKKYYDYAFSSLIPWDFFKNTDNPELYYRAYMLSKAYDTVAVAWDKYIVRMHEHDIDNKVPEQFIRGWDSNHRWHYDDFRTLNPAGWFGSSNWQTAIRLVNWLDENYRGTNPVRYIQALFEQEYGYYAWRKEQGDTKFKLYFPNFRQLNHKQFVDRYNKRLKNQKVMNEMHNNTLPVDDIASVRIKTMSKIWQGIIDNNEEASLETPNFIRTIIFDDQPNNIMSQHMSTYLDSLMANIELQKTERDLSDKELTIVNKFVDEQFAMLQGRLDAKGMLFSPNMYASLGTHMIEQARVLGIKGGWDIAPAQISQIIDNTFPNFSIDTNSVYINIDGNYVSNLKVIEGVMYEDYSTVAMLQTFDIVCLAKQRNNMYTSFNEIRNALNKVSDLVPLDRDGMLDFSKIDL